MNKLIAILFLLAFSSSYAQESNITKAPSQNLGCEKFKNGTFFIPADSIVPKTTLIRKGNRQKEIVDHVYGNTEFIVKWVDDCTYTLAPTKKTFKKHPEFPKNGVLTVQIIEVKENSYVQISSSNFSDMKITMEVIRVK